MKKVYEYEPPVSVRNDLSHPHSHRKGRDLFLDKWRGLAILLMIADHVAYFHGPDWLRQTLTRLSMPIFFILAGHLANRVSLRTLAIGATGFLLPIYVTWIDNPNVLLWLAIGSAVLAFSQHYPMVQYLTIILALTLMANYRIGEIFGSYHPAALLALMALGNLIPRYAFRCGDRLPGVFAFLGRFSLSIYIVHVVIFQIVSDLL